LYEGGIREPLIVYWPGVTKADSLCNVPVAGIDFMPTILKMAETDPAPEPCDGVDVGSLLHGSGSLQRDTLYWHYPHYSDQGGTPSGAIREGDWKLIEFFEDGHLELYNLALDPGEQYDFASSFADKASGLREKLRAWRGRMNASMPAPNPEYDPTKVQASIGHQGCSWSPGPACAED
jgi:arylsulfatase A